jgi:hypothetical protein
MVEIKSTSVKVDIKKKLKLQIAADLIFPIDNYNELTISSSLCNFLRYEIIKHFLNHVFMCK